MTQSFSHQLCKKGASLEMAGRKSHWLRAESTAWGRSQCVQLSAVPIQVSATPYRWSRPCSARPSPGRSNVRQRSGGWPAAGLLFPFHTILQRTRGTSMRGEGNYSSVSTQQPNPNALTRVVNRGILQKVLGIGASSVTPRCNARMALRVKRNWHIVWWCMFFSTTPLPMPSTSRLPFALPPRRCVF